MKPFARIVTLLTATGIAGAATALVARRRMIAAIPAELRNPLLYLPLSVSGERSLQFGRSTMPRPAPLRPGVSSRDVTIAGPGGDLKVVVYEREGRTGPSPALLWIHGGGLIMGTADGDNDLCSQLAIELDLVVVSVDYRLAPEHPFPAGLDDCVAALEWMAASSDELGVDHDRLVVGGASAGGGLAACVAQVAHDRGGPPLRLQLLVYPMLDDRTPLRTDLPRTTLVWSPASNRFAWTQYLGHPPAERDDRPYASAARRNDLTGLAPAWIGVGDVDLFHDEDVAYARRLREAGVPVDLHVVPGMYHAADFMAAGAASMQDFRRRMLEAVRTAVA